MSETTSRLIKIAAGAVFAAAILFISPASVQAQDAALIAKGDSIFNGMQMGACWACHGKAAKGTKTAPSLTGPKFLHMDGSAEAIKGIITNGVPKPKKTKTPMPAMGGAKLTPEQIDALAAYVHSLAKK